MPELPEVEVTMRGIKPALKDTVINAVWFDDKRLREPFSPDLKRLEGAVVLDVKRRAKYIVVKTSQGSLLIHLGMTGHLSMLKDPSDLSESSRKLHDHFELALNNGIVIRYNDSRRFGLIHYYPQDESPYEGDYLRDLGPEPLEDDFTADYLYGALSKRKKAVKLAIMDARVVVGVGNIYASEVLFLSRINPKRRACSLSKAECELLCREIKKTLARSIEKGGTTIINFQGADGKMGYFVQDLNVYGHAGKPCPVCANTILQEVIGQRSTYYCPVCQH